MPQSAPPAPSRRPPWGQEAQRVGEIVRPEDSRKINEEDRNPRNDDARPEPDDEGPRQVETRASPPGRRGSRSAPFREGSRASHICPHGRWERGGKDKGG